MTEKHPDQLELLSYVEDELDPDPRRALGEHLAACPSCAEQVRRLETGREVLRAAPLLDLSEDRRDAILESLPERPDPWGFLLPLKRALVMAAPVAAAAALVGVFVLAGTQLGSGGDDDSGDAAQVAADEGAGVTTGQGAGAEAAPGTEATPLRDAPEGATFVRTAQGPAAAVVRALQREGIPAEVDSRRVVIADARAGEVKAVLAGSPAGNVSVYVR